MTVKPPMKALCANGICISSDRPTIEIHQLSVRYGSFTAIHDISMHISPCTVTALIGPSGCGKTTFLSCLNRMTDLYPRCHVSGSIRIDGDEILDPATDVRTLRKRVGMVFQKPNPFPLSIWKNIALPLEEHGCRDRQQIGEKVERALSDVGLWSEVKDRLHSPAQALSGGQQQRLCIARTLALEPEVILLDEPCSALDPLSTELIEQLLLDLRQRFNVMIVTHNLSQARRVADDVAVFWPDHRGGRLLEFGAVAQIFERPAEAQTLAYVSGRVG